ncbi:STAS domain-containing protein [Hymenobacter persicinus]|uniref:STAS domain-containing protein n=1 Tax=Hymenobacter persicinus TaxID=2025506 RepID=A0A4Q5LJW0_9BACT|nr:hypothetical protein [Hymenobacter persicinus]RYU84312.1 hypothetical protein EWM57_01055 [Hymenobacter persicinus]
MEIYREILPESYLLILVDEALPTAPSETVLHQALSRAARSGKGSVWVDCSSLHQLPAHAAALLTRYGRKLNRQGVSLILCHLSEAVRKELLTQDPALAPLIVPTLLDAQQYCQQRINHVWAPQRLAG